MERHIKVFNEILSEPEFCQVTNKQISALTGFGESKISRFLKGKPSGGRIDLKAGEFFYLLEQMPQSFQERYWERMLKLQGIEKLAQWEHLDRTSRAKLLIQLNEDNLDLLTFQEQAELLSKLSRKLSSKASQFQDGVYPRLAV